MENIQDLTLWLDEAVWLDKDAKPVTVNLTTGSYTGTLPEGVTSLSAERVESERAGTYGVVRVHGRIEHPPLKMEYRDPEGGTHNTGGFSMRDDRADGREYEYLLQNYAWDTAEFDLDFTSVTAQPISIPLH